MLCRAFSSVNMFVCAPVTGLKKKKKNNDSLWMYRNDIKFTVLGFYGKIVLENDKLVEFKQI